MRNGGECSHVGFFFVSFGRVCLNVGVDVLMMRVTDYVTCDEWHFGGGITWRFVYKSGAVFLLMTRFDAA